MVIPFYFANFSAPIQYHSISVLCFYRFIIIDITFHCVFCHYKEPFRFCFITF